MLGIATGSDVQIGLVPQNSWSLHGNLLIIGREFLQGIEGFLVDQEPLLDPAFDSGGGAHAGEALLAIQDLHALPIFHVADSVKHGRNLVAQCRLRRRHVGHFEHPMTSAPAPRKQQDSRKSHDRNQPVRTK